MSKTNYTVPTANRYTFLDSDVDSEDEKKSITPPVTTPVQGSGNLAPTSAATVLSKRRDGQTGEGRRGGFESRSFNDQERRGGFRGGFRGDRGGDRGDRGGDRQRGDRVERGYNSNQYTNSRGGDWGREGNTAISNGPVERQGGIPEEEVDVQQEERGMHPRNSTYFRGRGGYRGDRGGLGAGYRNREYDRRSGTGRGKEVKKAGGGAHNWGNDTDEFREDSKEFVESQQSKKQLSDPAAGTNSSSESPSPQTPKDEIPAEPEQVMIHFEVYKKQLELKRVNLPKIAPAAPAPALNVEEFEKEGFERYERPESEERKGGDKRREEHVDIDDGENSHRPKTLNVFDFNQDTPSLRRRGGRGREDRGGGRGLNREFSGGMDRRQVRPDKVNLNLCDDLAFPVIG